MLVGGGTDEGLLGRGWRSGGGEVAGCGVDVLMRRVFIRLGSVALLTEGLRVLYDLFIIDAELGVPASFRGEPKDASASKSLDAYIGHQ